MAVSHGPGGICSCHRRLVGQSACTPLPHRPRFDDDPVDITVPSPVAGHVQREEQGRRARHLRRLETRSRDAGRPHVPRRGHPANRIGSTITVIPSYGPSSRTQLPEPMGDRTALGTADPTGQRHHAWIHSGQRRRGRPLRNGRPLDLVHGGGHRCSKGRQDLWANVAGLVLPLAVGGPPVHPHRRSTPAGAPPRCRGHVHNDRFRGARWPDRALVLTPQPNAIRDLATVPPGGGHRTGSDPPRQPDRHSEPTGYGNHSLPGRDYPKPARPLGPQRCLRHDRGLKRRRARRTGLQLQ